MLKSLRKTEMIFNLCVPFKRNDPDFMKGVELKKIWVEDMLRRWGQLLKLHTWEKLLRG